MQVPSVSYPCQNDCSKCMEPRNGLKPGNNLSCDSHHMKSSSACCVRGAFCCKGCRSVRAQFLCLCHCTQGWAALSLQKDVPCPLCISGNIYSSWSMLFIFSSEVKSLTVSGNCQALTQLGDFVEAPWLGRAASGSHRVLQA